MDTDIQKIRKLGEGIIKIPNFNELGPMVLKLSTEQDLFWVLSRKQNIKILINSLWLHRFQ